MVMDDYNFLRYKEGSPFYNLIQNNKLLSVVVTVDTDANWNTVIDLYSDGGAINHSISYITLN